MSAASAAEKSAEAAWTELAGDLVERPAFAYVANDAALPNVLIYGDSISIGYTPGVRAALAEKANVYRIHLNGGPSGTFIEKFDTLESTMRAPGLIDRWDFEWDVIHINVGLHDLKYVNEKGNRNVENGKLVADVAQYSANLREIIARLKTAAPQAKLILAMTTKVPPESKGRYENAELAYNAAVLRVLKDFPEIATNDLRTVSLPYEQPGNVHFKPEGIAAQAEHVAAVIAGHLPTKR